MEHPNGNRIWSIEYVSWGTGNGWGFDEILVWRREKEKEQQREREEEEELAL